MLPRTGCHCAGGGSGERQPWDFGRFLKTVVYFNPLPPPQEILKNLLQQPGKALSGMASSSVEVGSSSRGRLATRRLTLGAGGSPDVLQCAP